MILGKPTLQTVLEILQDEGCPGVVRSRWRSPSTAPIGSSLSATTSATPKAGSIPYIGMVRTCRLLIVR